MMPNSKSHRRVQELNRRGKLSEKSSSFDGRLPVSMPTEKQLRRPKTLPDLLQDRSLVILSPESPVSIPTEKQLRRPKTLPDLLQDRNLVSLSPETQPKKLTKLLLNVSIQGSVGAVQVLMSLENTVSDLVTSAVRQYVKECRRPILPTTDPSGFDLHYSQFSLESLSREEKLMDLGSRNFFLCSRKSVTECMKDGTTSSTTCLEEAGKSGKIGIPWLKFMDFLL